MKDRNKSVEDLQSWLTPVEEMQTWLARQLLSAEKHERQQAKLKQYGEAQYAKGLAAAYAWASLHLAAALRLRESGRKTAMKAGFDLLYGEKSKKRPRHATR